MGGRDYGSDDLSCYSKLVQCTYVFAFTKRDFVQAKTTIILYTCTLTGVHKISIVRNKSLLLYVMCKHFSIILISIGSTCPTFS